MFAMSQQYAYAAPPAPRQYSGTSSAFSASANPDEDWTKISDLAERRRIQNRIAQRNYRKKLKRRLEDLERRAGTSDEASSAASEKPAAGSGAKSTKRSPSAALSAAKQHQPAQPAVAAPPKAVAAPGQFTPPMHHDDELLFPPTYDDRERSHTPPFLAYPAYPPPDEILIAPYGAAQPYRPMTTEGYPDWVATTVPVTLPSMTHFSDAVKREGAFPGDDSMSPYAMNYGYLPGIDMNGPSPYDSNPHTPPLSHSFDHSTNCSEAGYEYPTTPLSMPGSPGMTHPHH